MPSQRPYVKVAIEEGSRGTDVVSLALLASLERGRGARGGEESTASERG